MADCSVFVVFGVELSSSQYYSLIERFYPGPFVNVGTGLTPDGERWGDNGYDDEFDTVEEEYQNIVDGWISHPRVPGTEYRFISVNDCSSGETHFFLSLHLHIHTIDGVSSKELSIPTTEEVKRFRTAVESVCNVSFDDAYKVMTVTSTIC